MRELPRFSGRIVKAPEGHLDPVLLEAARVARRRFMGRALAFGAGAAATGLANAQGGGSTAAAGPPGKPSSSADGDPAILNLPAHTTGLGQPVAATGYGAPSTWERNIQRRQSPGLTQVAQASVSFCPLQSLFGIITPSGLHFERHHQGWWDIDPAQHRLMVNGLVREARVFTMDDLMRLPSVSRIHFIECGANSAMEWGNVAVPTVQYTHGMLSCASSPACSCRPCSTLCGADLRSARTFVLAEGADGSSMTRTIAIERALDDVIVAWGMNGEMLRPENGYPLRLVVPGVQGVSAGSSTCVASRSATSLYYTKDEELHYVDLMPDGTSSPVHVDPGVQVGDHDAVGRADAARHGYYNVTGLAWSGRGKVQAGRRQRRRRPQLAHRAARRAGAVEGADPLQHRLGLGRHAGDAAVARDRRDRLRAAEDQPAARGARHALDLPQQRDPVVARRRDRRGHERAGVLSRGWHGDGRLHQRRTKGMACRGARSRSVSAVGIAALIGERGDRSAGGGVPRRSASPMPSTSPCADIAPASRAPRPRPRSRAIGRAATPAEVRAWDIDVRGDFAGLPPGAGNVALGERIWEARCAACHGVFGESNEVFTPLVGGTTKQDIETGRVKSLVSGGHPHRTTLMRASRLSTLWDYVHRAMPWNAPKSLAPDEVYGVLAYLLNLGEIVPDDFTLSDRNIAETERRLPNRHGKVFFRDLWEVARQGRCREPRLHARLPGRGPARGLAARRRAQRERQHRRAGAAVRAGARHRHVGAAAHRAGRHAVNRRRPRFLQFRFNGKPDPAPPPHPGDNE